MDSWSSWCSYSASSRILPANFVVFMYCSNQNTPPKKCKPQKSTNRLHFVSSKKPPNRKGNGPRARLECFFCFFVFLLSFVFFWCSLRTRNVVVSCVHIEMFAYFPRWISDDFGCLRDRDHFNSTCVRVYVGILEPMN